MYHNSPDRGKIFQQTCLTLYVPQLTWQRGNLPADMTYPVSTTTTWQRGNLPEDMTYPVSTTTTWQRGNLPEDLTYPVCTTTHLTEGKSSRRLDLPCKYHNSLDRGEIFQQTWPTLYVLQLTWQRGNLPADSSCCCSRPGSGLALMCATFGCGTVHSTPRWTSCKQGKYVCSDILWNMHWTGEKRCYEKKKQLNNIQP